MRLSVKMKEKFNKTFNVRLLPDARLTENIEPNTIYIYPKKKEWNDFKYKTHCLFVVKLEKGIIEGNILASIIDDISTSNEEYTGLGNVFENGSVAIEEITSKGLFFTLLSSMDEYRNLVYHAGTEQAEAILTSINDIVFISEYKKNTPWLNNALQSDVFKKSFMRNSEPFFAFHNAADILNGLEFEELDYISNTLELTFKLDTFRNAHTLNLNFGNATTIPKRINIFIGENGLGKSQCLNQFVRAALRQRGYANNLIDPERSDARPMINRILAIGTPGETSNTYPNDSIKNPKLNYRRLLLTRNGRSKNNSLIGSSIVKLARQNKRIGNVERWEIFIDSIFHALPLDKIYIPLNNNKSDLPDFVPLVDIQSGFNEERQLTLWSNIDDNAEPKIKGSNGFYPMSSGQLSFFKFALLASLNIENGSFVLLDEPETHLHPSLISDFISLLDSILEKTGSYALIATHSPYFVREVTREQVHIFKKDAHGNIQIQKPRLKTFGANIGDISYFVFDEEHGNSLSKNIISRFKDSDESYEQLKSELLSEIPTEMLYEIKSALEKLP